jgi:3-hydroxyacyl-CoA dehydrogenase
VKTTIRKCAVLGSGVMGAAIAAHLAGVGLETVLLDRVPQAPTPEEQAKGTSDRDPRFRNRLAEQAVKRLAGQKPSPIYTKEVLERIQTGNLEDDMQRLEQVDWIIEVVVENLEVKKALLEQVEKHWRPGTIVSSNTSGISVRAMVEGRSAVFREHCMGTHFFNPPRYMKLLEIVPTEYTDPEKVERMRVFCERKLGKGVVIAKDTPNFIANRIGTYGLLISLAEMEKRGLSVADVDALTGTAIGRPKSATFRTLDMVGLDTFVHVAGNVADNVDDPAEKAMFAVPETLSFMVGQGWLGEKSGQGFYQVKREKGGAKQILQFDYRTRTYAAQNGAKFASIEQAKNSRKVKDRLRMIAYSDDAGGGFVWHVLKKTLLYAAGKIGEIADDIRAVDDAMKWGFNWELGPFEIWDALGVEKAAARMEQEGEAIPDWVKEHLAAGNDSFYRKRDAKAFYIQKGGQWAEKGEPKENISLAALKEKNGVIRKNTGASLIDMGDDVACLEFHSMNNTIGPDVMQMIHIALDEVSRNYRGLVIGHQGKHFCVGANLMMLLMEAQDENWFEIEQMITQLQGVSMAMKYFAKPIVAAPFGMTLGGGVEVCIPAVHVQASAETYMGLVEAGVGLIPAGGGTKELLYRFTVPVDFDGKVDLQPYVNRAFETIGMAKVSTSAAEARQLGYLRESDRITVHPDHVLYDAKQAVIGMSTGGYEPPRARKVRVVGEPGMAVLKLGAYQWRCSGHISEYDEHIGKKLAYVLAGGHVPEGSMVTEQYLLDLEREAFLSLCGEPKTQARMQHMLLTRKPLRN